ncbi:hypothetical protein CC86DRAFT_457127 [Ophiobolus disseminans]|uniref:Bacteriophage T5 Orf172 DNA-binding domain-containing protein n=1 Tax=Ophiobolus disseminans TaxID=1469910 RepID=A0A6A6ZTE4_9PLEO|nr:hypothetical protein CC86DRAFT_457127 [Ophiobolus disseminans]
MFPGRFPSPTPTRESTPIESIEGRHDVFATSPRQPATPDYTAPETSRKRPRFAEVQSEPIISRPNVDHYSNTPPAVSSPTPNPRKTNNRRVSDPLRTGRRKGRQRDDDVVPNQRDQWRVFSTPAMLSSLRRNSVSETPPSDDHTPPINNNKSPPTPRDADTKLYNKLTSPLSPSDTDGVVYVLADPLRKELGIKIGYTTCLDYTARIKQHAESCEFTPQELYATQSLSHCKRTEILAHLDIADRCKHWECKTKKCDGTTHKEWFQVDKDFAVRTVKKWEAFMDVQRPYDIRKEFNPVWKYVVQQRRTGNPVDNNASHEARRKQWDEILVPLTYRDYISFVAHLALQLWYTVLATLLSIWPHIWQAVTVVYGFVTVLSQSRKISLRKKI